MSGGSGALPVGGGVASGASLHLLLAICVLYTSSVLQLGKRRLASMLRKRERHIKDDANIAKLVDVDAHVLNSPSTSKLGITIQGDATKTPPTKTKTPPTIAEDEVVVAVKGEEEVDHDHHGGMDVNRKPPKKDSKGRPRQRRDVNVSEAASCVDG